MYRSSRQYMHRILSAMTCKSGTVDWCWGNILYCIGMCYRSRKSYWLYHRSDKQRNWSNLDILASVSCRQHKNQKKVHKHYWHTSSNSSLINKFSNWINKLNTEHRCCLLRNYLLEQNLSWYIEDKLWHSRNWYNCSKQLSKKRMLNHRNKIQRYTSNRN